MATLTLFLLYINDIPLNIHEEVFVLFADGTIIPVVDKNEDSLQQKILYVMKELEMQFQKNVLL
jgi:hypothetical protein